MKKHLSVRVLATVIALAILVQMVPVQILAAEENDITTALSASSERAETVSSSEDARIVEEITEKRTEYTKQFRLSNGLHMAVVYPEAVHYRDDGQWKEIDNTLQLSGSFYSNTAGGWEVCLPQQISSNEAVTVTKDGYTLSFKMAGELRADNQLSMASVTASQQELHEEPAESVAAQVVQIDLRDAKESAEHPETVPDKLQSRLQYENIYSGTDIIYDLNSNQLKESIVMESYSPTLRGYRYTLHTGAMTPVLQDTGWIELYGADSTEPVMYMPAPYLLDGANEYCDNVTVELTGSNGNYILTYLLPIDWLGAEDRQWPVILDPIVSTVPSTSNIRDITLYQKNATANYMGGVLECGVTKNYGLSRGFLQYVDLPDITSSDVIVNAKLSLYKVKTHTVSTLVEVHKICSTWNNRTVTWDTQPAYDSKAEDFANVREIGQYLWDITDIVQSWYRDGNYGLAITMPKALEDAAYQYDLRKQFWSSDYSSQQVDEKPTVYIYFRNNNGLEEYWNYTAASAGRAGTGYVNTFTGNLVWTRGDIGFGGNRSPVSISHVYNLNDVITPDDNNNSNDTAGNTFGVGMGWRTNYNQLIYAWEIDGVTKSTYIWEDSDGTDHYFVYDEETQTYKDEDGLELTLTVNGTGTEKYCITGKYGSCSYFDEQGRLTKLSNNQATKSHTTITYTSDTSKLISTVTDGVGRVYSFTYTDGLLTQISYLSTGTEVISYVRFEHTGNLLTKVTDKDGKYSTYTYDTNNLLITAQDVDGYKLTYSYNEVPADEPWRAYRVQTMEESDGETLGGKTTFAYSHNQTILTDHNNSQNILQFNDFGNLICIQDDEGRAQFAQYAFNTDTEKEDSEDATAKSHQLRVSSELQYTVVNLMADNDLRTTADGWTALSGASKQLTADRGYADLSSLCVTTTSADSGVVSSSFTLAAGQTHTFSCYVLSDAVGVYLQAQSGDSVANSTVSTSDGQWHRLQVSYTNEADTACTVTYSVLAAAAGTFYMDCTQLENAPTASRYNLINNGDFSHTVTSAQWTGTGLAATDGVTALTEDQPTIPHADGNVLKIDGAHLAQKRMTQSVYTDGKEGDYYTIAGWAMGNSVPVESEDTNPRAFAIQAVLVYTDGTQSDPFAARFNPDSDQWQYSATGIIAEKDFQEIQVSLVYDYNANTVYFDGIQLYKDGFGAKIEYDEDGNVVRILSSMNQEDRYVYNTNNDLTQEILSTGAELNYTYDNYHNVTGATTEEGLAYTFTYDVYGNNLSVSISDGTSTITSYAAYTTDGNRMVTATNSLGKITTYEYDPDTNVLKWVQYPEDTDATKTVYTYDEMYRQTKIASTTDTGLNMSVQYTYDSNDYLTQVKTPTTTYNFEYGVFGLRTSVKIGSRTLATYHYTEDRNFYLARLDYDNDDKVEYTYDDKGRVLSAVYEDGDTISYTYDSTGRLATVADSATGRTTTYTYDFADRTAKYTETGANYSHSVEYGYDETGKLISQTEIINGTTHSTAYTYDLDNRVTAKTTDGITVEYTYDGLGRVSQQVTKNGDTTVKTETYTFNANSAQVATYRTQAGSYDVTYTYTYDDNGNILTVYDGTNTTSYVYDSQNQLIRENNQASGFTRTWTYDNAGNILSRNQYSHTADELGTVKSTASYTYGDEDWGDLLTAYNGTAISYDNIGNPTVYRGMQFTWEHGRQLASAQYGSVTETYTYDTDGMRIGRTSGSNTYKYVYNGSQLVRMEYNSHVLEFTYDAQGTPISVTHNGTRYFYVTNLQGDVVRIVSDTGAVQAQYLYDAWGTCATFASKPVGQLNPLRYRGYVYDQETELYYLQSRYYDPAVGRFINADTLVKTPGTSVLSTNMFAYCENNPVMHSDSTGQWFGLDDLIAGAVGAVVGVVSQLVSDVVESACSGSWQFSSWETYVGAGFGGGVSGVAALYTGPVVSAAIGEGASTLFGQALENITGSAQRSATEILANATTSATIGALVTKYLPIKVTGVTSGRNSMSAVYKSGLTKIGNKTASKMSFKVIIKGVVAGVVEGLNVSIAMGVKEASE